MRHCELHSCGDNNKNAAQHIKQMFGGGGGGGILFFKQNLNANSFISLIFIILLLLPTDTNCNAIRDQTRPPTHVATNSIIIIIIIIILMVHFNGRLLIRFASQFIHWPSSAARHVQLIASGQLCRDSSNECDLPEFCTGESGLCPPDVYMKNGSPCGHEHATNEPTGECPAL